MKTVLTSVFLAFAIPAFAQDATWFEEIQAREMRNEFEPAKATYSIGFTRHSYLYEEASMREASSFSGIVGRVDRPFADSALQLVGEFDFQSGDGRYDGQTWGGDPLQKDAKTRYHTLRGLVGGRQIVNETNKIFWYGGFGRRELVNRYQGAGGYTREARYDYLPLGIEWTSKVSDVATTIVGLEFDILLRGTTTSRMSEVDSNLPNVTKNQPSGTGYRLTAAFSRKIGEYGVQIQPFFHRWNIADSEIEHLIEDLYILEPANSTTEIGANFSVLF